MSPKKRVYLRYNEEKRKVCTCDVLEAGHKGPCECGCGTRFMPNIAPIVNVPKLKA